MKIKGGRIQEIKYTPKGNPYVNHRGRRYKLEEFLDCHNKVWNQGNPFEEMGYDGYLSDSYFSGVLLKFEDAGDSARVYTYYS